MRPPWRRGEPKRTKVRNPDDTMTLVEHLGELRTRLIKAILAIVAGAIVVFLFYDPVLTVLAEPYETICTQNPEFGCTGEFLITDPIDGFATRMRVSGYGGLVLALPVVLWQLWRFIVPALHKHERRYAIPFVLSSVALFLFGAAIAYWTLPKALQFLIGFSGEGVTANFNPGRYIRLITLMMVGFGGGFLFPVLLVFLQLVGILTPQTLRKSRRFAIVGIVVFAAVITPSGDPYSLAALSLPMYLFFELSILIGWLVQRRRLRSQASAASPTPA